MYIYNEDTEQELTIRLVLETDNERDYFDDYHTLEEMSEAASRITSNAMIQSAKDGIERMVGFAIIHKSRYGQDGHGKGLEVCE